MACYCCSSSCQPGCECHRYPANECRNCGHLNIDHATSSPNFCVGVWNGYQSCPCRAFELDTRPSMEAPESNADLKKEIESLRKENERLTKILTIIGLNQG